MGRKARMGVAVALAGLVIGPAAVTRADVPNINWTALLPALPSPVEPQPGAVPNCEHATRACIRVEIQRLRSLRDKLGCDHGGVFATTYLTLTKQFLDDLRADALDVEHLRYLYYEDALFADVYFRTVRRWEQGKSVPEAWRIAFQTAASGDANAAQDMLLGINAHVQNDMPFVIAALGLRTPDGDSRKPDHDAENAVLNHAYERVVSAVGRRYDSIISITNASWSPIDDIAGLEAVRGWREVVWRNAERLVNASSDAERAQVAAQIQSYAGAWASTIALPQVPPGYRATRDAYCQSQLAR
jgi:Family of unknown function (DUF5995)